MLKLFQTAHIFPPLLILEKGIRRWIHVEFNPYESFHVMSFPEYGIIDNNVRLLKSKATPEQIFNIVFNVSCDAFCIIFRWIIFNLKTLNPTKNSWS